MQLNKRRKIQHQRIYVDNGAAILSINLFTEVFALIFLNHHFSCHSVISLARHFDRQRYQIYVNLILNFMLEL